MHKLFAHYLRIFWQFFFSCVCVLSSIGFGKHALNCRILTSSFLDFVQKGCVRI